MSWRAKRFLTESRRSSAQSPGLERYCSGSSRMCTAMGYTRDSQGAKLRSGEDCALRKLVRGGQAASTAIAVSAKKVGRKPEDRQEATPGISVPPRRSETQRVA